MRADKFLSERFGSRSKAKEALCAGRVLLHGKPLAPDSELSSEEGLTVLEVPAVHFEELRVRAEAEPSAEVKARVDAARNRQHARFGEESRMCNARMGQEELRRWCALDSEGAELMEQAYEALGLTARSYDRIVKVARTIADLDGSEQIRSQHIAEAIQYRTAGFGPR